MDQRIFNLPAQAQDLLNHQASPLRIRGRYRIGAAPEQVFRILGDLEGITRFFPLIHYASVDHVHGWAGEGSTRVCSVRGMGKVRERIAWWAPPHGYAYRADGPFVPLRDHLGFIWIQPDGTGGSVLEWRQYFRTRLGPMGWIFRWMMPLLMRRAVTNISRLLRASVPRRSVLAPSE